MDRKVLFPSELLEKKYVYGTPVISNDNKLAKIKVWYKKNNVPTNLFIQIGSSTIVEVSDDEIMLDLSSRSCLPYEQLDQLSVNRVESMDLLKKLNMTGESVSYTAIVHTKTLSNGKEIDVLKFKIFNTEQPVHVFDQEKNVINPENYSDVFFVGAKVNVIVEVDSVVINVSEEKLYTNLITRQILVSNVSPVVTELNEFSFVDEHTNDTNCFFDDVMSEHLADDEQSDDLNRKTNLDVDADDVEENAYESSSTSSNHHNKLEQEDNSDNESNSESESSLDMPMSDDNSDTESERESSESEVEQKQTKKPTKGKKGKLARSQATKKQFIDLSDSDSDDSVEVSNFLASVKGGKKGKK